MRILVDPDQLRALASHLQQTADRLHGQTSRLSGAVAALHWEVRRQAAIQGQAEQAHQMAHDLSARLAAMAQYVQRKAELFEQADRQGAEAIAHIHELHLDMFGQQVLDTAEGLLGAGMALGALGALASGVGDSFEGTAAGISAEGQSSGEPETYHPTNMQEMVDLLEEGDDHIRIMKVGENDYVVLLKGTAFDGRGVTYDITGAVHGGLELSGEYESLIREFIEEKITDTDANIHFVGHSLGGIVANNLADNQDFRDRYPNLQSVTTFGSPANVRESPGVEYNRYWNSTDVVPTLNASHMFRSFLNPVLMSESTDHIVNEQIGIDSGHTNPIEAHNMKNYALALEHEGTPAALEHLLEPGTTWQEYASASGKRESNNATNIISDLGLFSYSDMVFEISRTKAVAIPTFFANEATSMLPADHPLYVEIDRWNDRCNQFIISKPTPSEVAGGIIDGAVNVGGQTIYATRDAVEKGAQIADNAIDKGSDVVGGIAETGKDAVQLINKGIRDIL